MSDLIELGEPDIIHKEDNILWLRAENKRLTAEAKQSDKYLEALEAGTGKRRQEMERLQTRVDELERTTVTTKYHDEIIHCAQVEIAKRDKRIAELEEIVRLYADPTGAPDDECKLIMSCHDSWIKQEVSDDN